MTIIRDHTVDFSDFTDLLAEVHDALRGRAVADVTGCCGEGEVGEWSERTPAVQHFTERS